MKKLCLGTWQFEESFNKVTLEEAKILVQYAKEKGIRKFDTALVYGNEKIEKMLSEVIESSDFVITKIPAIKKPELSKIESIEKFYPLESIDSKIDKSIHNLKRFPDVLLLHNWVPYWDETSGGEKVFKRLQELKEKGVLKMFGVSLPNYYGENISDWLLSKVDFIEAPYNQNNRWVESSIVKIKEKKVKLAIRSIFEKGDYFKGEANKEEIKNIIVKAYNMSEYLIIGMTKKSTIDENIKVVKEYDYE